jgi:hypothetical protein
MKSTDIFFSAIKIEIYVKNFDWAHMITLTSGLKYRYLSSVLKFRLDTVFMSENQDWS